MAAKPRASWRLPFQVIEAHCVRDEAKEYQVARRGAQEDLVVEAGIPDHLCARHPLRPAPEIPHFSISFVLAYIGINRL